MISLTALATADHRWDRDNAAGIGDNSAEIGGRDRLYCREHDPMLNSILNGDWSYSVPGRQIPEGSVVWVQPPRRGAPDRCTVETGNSSEFLIPQ